MANVVARAPASAVAGILARREAGLLERFDRIDRALSVLIGEFNRAAAAAEGRDRDDQRTE